MTDYSNIYENETIEFAKNNPHIDVGQVVNVWNEDNPEKPVYCGRGRILTMVWDKYYEQYCVDIEMFYMGRVQKFCTFACCCERSTVRELRAVR